MLLDIVAKSLYSEKEVFLRELISNASDAMEKLRFERLQSGQDTPADMAVTLTTNKTERTLTVQDTGVGFTKEELVAHLGTIAKSGTKSFMEGSKGKGNTSSLIGQFGVGFYSAFMVADKVEVITKSTQAEGAYKWTSLGGGSFEIEEATPDFPHGTKIVLHLKQECREFSDASRLKAIIEKYINFLNYPILLDGAKANKQEPVWSMPPKDISDGMHHEFYRYLSKSFNSPRFFLHFHTDVPISIQAVLYFPEGKPGLFDLGPESETPVALYARKVLIKPKASEVIPRWLRFLHGVVDSEDIPLNLSREILQDSALLAKVKSVLTGKVIKFLVEKCKKEKDRYKAFYEDYGVFLKEGVMLSNSQNEKEDIANLLLYESSKYPAGEKVTIAEYCERIQAGQSKIYYLAAPSRELAERSPYFEVLKNNGYEVLFCFENYDEVVLMNLRQFKGTKVISVETEVRSFSPKTGVAASSEGALPEKEADSLTSWLTSKLRGKAHSVIATCKLDSFPCVVTVEEMASARHFLKTHGAGMKDDLVFSILQPRLEINPKHALIKKLSLLKDSEPQLADLLAMQLFNNALVAAGLIDDPRKGLKHLNDLLESVFQKIK